MNYYTVCPSCEYKLLKAGEGSNIEITCPKCGQKMTIEIKDGNIVILRILSNKTDGA
jgi:phage FluMu protein Com